MNRRQMMRGIAATTVLVAVQSETLLAQPANQYVRQVALYAGDSRVYYEDGRKCWNLQKPVSGAYHQDFMIYKKKPGDLQYGDAIQLSVQDRYDANQRLFWCSQPALAPMQAAKYSQQIADVSDPQTRFTIWSPDGASGEIKTGTDFLVTDWDGTYIAYEAKIGNLNGPFLNADGNKTNAARFNLVFLPAKE
jgi:hypothetical protein